MRDWSLSTGGFVFVLSCTVVGSTVMTDEKQHTENVRFFSASRVSTNHPGVGKAMPPFVPLLEHQTSIGRINNLLVVLYYVLSTLD